MIGCYAEPVSATVGKSVCLSVCHTLVVKTAQGKNTKSSPTDRPRTILAIKRRPRPTSRNSKGSPRARALNTCGIGKI